MKLNDSNLFRQQALINGEWLDANNGEAIDVTNPANGDKLGSVHNFAGANAQGHIVQGMNAAEALVNPGHFEQIFLGHGKLLLLIFCGVRNKWWVAYVCRLIVLRRPSLAQ